MKNTLKYLLLGAVMGIVGVLLWQHLTVSDKTVENNAEEQPLYWVAPMDPNFRRDQPGKSPMGMDLVPVYASELNSSQSSAGEISISPTVVNNLGVKTAQAYIGTIENTIKTVGVVQYDENKLVHVHPRVEGWIEKLYVQSMGDQVVKGDVLYEIYSPELVNAQEEFILALRRDNSALTRAAEARLRSLQIPTEIIASIKRNKTAFQAIPFYSPQDGVIEHLEIREGFYVKPGTTLMSIADLSTVWVEAQVLSAQKAFLEQGAQAHMRIKALPDRLWQGAVEYMYPSLDPQNKTARARLVFSNDEQLLKPNMYVDIEISQPEMTGLIIPKDALIRLQNTHRVVLVTDSGGYKSVAVNPGAFDDLNVEIKSGLIPGDVVVTSAQFLLDSESSKTSDFDRMSLADMEDVAQTVGVIQDLDTANRTLNISREAIEKWGRPAATLDFSVSDRVLFDQFEVNQKIRFYFQVQSGRFTILHVEHISPMQVVDL